MVFSVYLLTQYYRVAYLNQGQDKLLLFVITFQARKLKRQEGAEKTRDGKELEHIYFTVVSL